MGTEIGTHVTQDRLKQHNFPSSKLTGLHILINEVKIV
jgi:hypothetical protein